MDGRVEGKVVGRVGKVVPPPGRVDGLVAGVLGRVDGLVAGVLGRVLGRVAGRVLGRETLDPVKGERLEPPLGLVVGRLTDRLPPL